MSEPLRGVRVVELGSTVAGPFCARLFADFGAQVIKVEDPQGDAIRSMGPAVAGSSLHAASLLRNKSTASIDLRHAEGRAAVRRLIARCDVLVENFRPGAMEEWGLDYRSLSADNPGLVMVRISGFGQSGPYRQRVGYGVIGEAVSGLRSVTGDPDRPPARVGVALTDYITGLYAAFGAMVALHERRASGRGQVVDAALSECAFSLMEGFVPVFGRFGIAPQRCGARLAGSAPNNLFASRDGLHIHVAAFADPVFRRLCAAMERPELADDARFRDGSSRWAHVEQIDAIVAEWVGARDAETVERILSKASVPASRVLGLEEIFSNAHFQARGMLLHTTDPELGELTLAAPVPVLERTPARVRHPGRGLGADTVRVLTEVAGYSAEEVVALARTGALGARVRGGAPEETAQGSRSGVDTGRVAAP